MISFLERSRDGQLVMHKLKKRRRYFPILKLLNKYNIHLLFHSWNENKSKDRSFSTTNDSHNFIHWSFSPVNRVTQNYGLTPELIIIVLTTLSIFELTLPF